MEATPTNPTNLDLAITMPTLALADAAGLKSWALSVKEKYAGLVILEEQTIGAKAEIAELRRIAKQLNDSRIAAVKQVSGPIRDFESQVKEVAGIFLETADGIDSQVKNYEAQARETKRQEVLFAIETLTAENGYPGMQIPVQEHWLNKSQKPKQTAAEILAVILAHRTAQDALAAAEQAKQDRAVAIEAQNATLARGYGFTLPVSQFVSLFDLAVALADVNERMTNAYRLKAEQMDRENVAPVSPSTPVAAPATQAVPMQAQAPLSAPQGSAGRKTLTVSLDFGADLEAQVNMSLRQLEGLGVRVARTPCMMPPPAQAERPARRY